MLASLFFSSSTSVNQVSTALAVSSSQSVKSVLTTIKIMKGGEVFIMKSMKCFKIYDLALALANYFNKNKKIKDIIKISNKFHGEKFEEELYSINEMQYLKTQNNLFVILSCLLKYYQQYSMNIVAL